MEIESIERLLETVCKYNTVKITQVFTREKIEIVSVRCVPGTRTLELTHLETGNIEFYTSIAEAAKAIEEHIRPI